MTIPARINHLTIVPRQRACEPEEAHRATGGSHAPLSPAYRSALLMPAPELFCLFLIIADTRSRYIIDPNRIRIIKFADQNPAVVIRDHRDVASRPACVEPGRVVFCKLNSEGFQSAFLRIIGCYFHAIPFSLFPSGSV